MKLLAIFAFLAAAGLADVPFTATARVSRTAVWVGDHFDYTIRVEYDPQIEFVKDHLKKDEVNLQPFEVVDAVTSTGTLQKGRKFLEVRFELVTYAANANDIAIPPVTLFYFKQARGAGNEDAPADTLNIPAFSMAVRSTVVDASQGIRDRKPPLPISRASWLIPLVLGLCGLAAVGAGVARYFLARARSGIWKQKLAERNRKKSLHESVQEIRGIPATTPEELANFYEKASAILRGLAAEKLGDGAALTPGEMQRALMAAGDPEHHATTLSELLAQCDTVRYTPGGLDHGRKCHAEFLSKFDELTDKA